MSRDSRSRSHSAAPMANARCPATSLIVLRSIAGAAGGALAVARAAGSATTAADRADSAGGDWAGATLNFAVTNGPLLLAADADGLFLACATDTAALEPSAFDDM